MSEDEQRGVLRKYDTKGTGMVNYREFCATVDNGVCVCVIHSNWVIEFMCGLYKFTCTNCIYHIISNIIGAPYK